MRDAARRVKAAADADPDAIYRRIHAALRLSRHTDSHGAYHLSLRSTAIDGARIDTALQPMIDALIAANRLLGRHEPVHAYAVDALIALLTGQRPTVLDDATQARGYHCEVPGSEGRRYLEIDHIRRWTITHKTPPRRPRLALPQPPQPPRRQDPRRMALRRPAQPARTGTRHQPHAKPHRTTTSTDAGHR